MHKATFINGFNPNRYWSTDRRNRFQSVKKTSIIENDEIDGIIQLESIMKLDWILLKKFDGVARVLEFKYLGVKTKKMAVVSDSFVKIGDATEKKQIGMLLQFFIVDANGNLKMIEPNEIGKDFGRFGDFISIFNYRLHIPSPVRSASGLMFCAADLQLVSNYITFNPSTPFRRGFNVLTSTHKKNMDQDVDYQPSTSSQNKKGKKEKQREYKKTGQKTEQSQSKRRIDDDDGNSDEHFEELLSLASRLNRRRNLKKTESEDFVYLSEKFENCSSDDDFEAELIAAKRTKRRRISKKNKNDDFVYFKP